MRRRGWVVAGVGGAVLALAVAGGSLREAPAPVVQPLRTEVSGGAGPAPPALREVPPPSPAPRPPLPPPPRPEPGPAPRRPPLAEDAGAAEGGLAPGPDGGALADAKQRFLRRLEATLHEVGPEVAACRAAWQEADASLAGLSVEFALVPGDGGYALEPRFPGDAGLGQAALRGCILNALAGVHLEALNEGLQAGQAVLGNTVMRIWLKPAAPDDGG